MKRVLLIHQAFATPQDPGGTRHYELMQHCQSDGFRFIAVTSLNSYLDGKRRGAAGHKWAKREHHQGIEVMRTYSGSDLHKSYLWRVLAYLSFMVSSLVESLRAGPVDLVWGTSPPLFQLVSAWLVALIRRCPFLLEVRDLWPEFAIDMGVLTNHILIRLSRWLESFLYARADAILVNSPAYQDYLLARGIPASKVTLVANGVDTAQFAPQSRGQALRRRWGVEDKFVVTYAGALGPANAIGGILKAAEHLRHHPTVVFVLAGAGKDLVLLQQQAKDMGLDNVRFVGSLPKAEMPQALAASDACLATLQNIPMFRTTYPNKVFDYMAAGRPVVLAIEGVIAEVVQKAQAGILVPPEDDSAMARAVERLANDRALCQKMGHNGRAYVEAHFERDQQAQAFARLLGRVMKQ
ncbi:MAG: glycosyltransferase family 4 protein [Desulfarculaceae bacterium]|nr:glycosyltransferase family 4 protein [Desulfarculaceae bacterium]MCF8118300.1 glycosyltransferase family 4 protein [Desulfarculaceae bacterium]